jgi:hypothetical protein
MPRAPRSPRLRQIHRSSCTRRDTWQNNRKTFRHNRATGSGLAQGKHDSPQVTPLPQQAILRRSIIGLIDMFGTMPLVNGTSRRSRAQFYGKPSLIDGLVGKILVIPLQRRREIFSPEIGLDTNPSRFFSNDDETECENNVSATAILLRDGMIQKMN